MSSPPSSKRVRFSLPNLKFEPESSPPKLEPESSPPKLEPESSPPKLEPESFLPNLEPQSPQSSSLKSKHQSLSPPDASFYDSPLLQCAQPRDPVSPESLSLSLLEGGVETVNEVQMLQKEVSKLKERVDELEEVVVNLMKEVRQLRELAARNIRYHQCN